MTVQTRRYSFGYKLLQNAIYDVVDKIDAKLVSGDSNEGVYRIRLSDGYGELIVQITGDTVCNVTVTAGDQKVPKYGYEKENWDIQHFFSNLEVLLAGLK